MDMERFPGRKQFEGSRDAKKRNPSAGVESGWWGGRRVCSCCKRNWSRDEYDGIVEYSIDLYIVDSENAVWESRTREEI